MLTDSDSWLVVYGLLIATVIGSLICTGGSFNTVSAGTEPGNIENGILKGLLLLPGPFTYPYYYTLFKYNEQNEDGTANTNVKKSFILAGLMFGLYMVLAAVLTFVQFSPALNVLKAFLITLIAASSLTTYIYSEYLVWAERKANEVLSAHAQLERDLDRARNEREKLIGNVMDRAYVSGSQKFYRDMRSVLGETVHISPNSIKTGYILADLNNNLNASER